MGKPFTDFALDWRGILALAVLVALLFAVVELWPVAQPEITP